MSDFQKATYKDLPREEFKRLEKFRHIPIEELKKIKPIWAVNENKAEAWFVFLERYVVEYISPRILIENANMLDLSTAKLFNNDINDFRYVTTLERWQSNLSVDPPRINIDNNLEKPIEFGDGRHRAILGYILEAQSIPVLIHKSQIDDYKMFVFQKVRPETSKLI